MEKYRLSEGYVFNTWKPLLSKSDIEDVIKNNGMLLQFLTKEEQTIELVILACKQNPEAYQYVKIDLPPEIKDMSSWI